MEYDSETFQKKQPCRAEKGGIPMDAAEKLQDGLERKKKLFQRYRDLTERLLRCPEEELNVVMAHRQALCREIDAVDREMAQAAGESEDPEQVAKAMRLSCRRSQVPERYRFLFDRAQEVFALINQTRNLEPLIAERLEDRLQELTERIKETNRSVSAQAARFTPGVATQEWNGISRKA